MSPLSKCERLQRLLERFDPCTCELVAAALCYRQSWLTKAGLPARGVTFQRFPACLGSLPSSDRPFPMTPELAVPQSSEALLTTA